MSTIIAKVVTMLRNQFFHCRLLWSASLSHTGMKPWPFLSATWMPESALDEGVSAFASSFAMAETKGRRREGGVERSRAPGGDEEPLKRMRWKEARMVTVVVKQRKAKWDLGVPGWTGRWGGDNQDAMRRGLQSIGRVCGGVILPCLALYARWLPWGGFLLLYLNGRLWSPRPVISLCGLGSSRPAPVDTLSHPRLIIILPPPQRPPHTRSTMGHILLFFSPTPTHNDNSSARPIGTTGPSHYLTPTTPKPFASKGPVGSAQRQRCTEDFATTGRGRQ